MIKLAIWSRKIHRILVLIISFQVLIMAFSGIVMKYPTTFGGFNPILLRYVHNQISPIFGTTLFLMMATGLGMYFLPILIKRRAEKLRNNSSNSGNSDN